MLLTMLITIPAKRGHKATYKLKLYTYIHTLFEIGSVMGSQRLMWTYIKATLYK